MVLLKAFEGNATILLSTSMHCICHTISLYLLLKCSQIVESDITVVVIEGMALYYIVLEHTHVTVKGINQTLTTPTLCPKTGIFM